jgi:hypothetical protein
VLGQAPAAFAAQVAFHMLVVGQREMHRDRLPAQPHFQPDAVVLQQQGELLR